MNTITKQEFIAIWKKISNDKRRLPTFVDQPYYGENHKMKVKGFIYPVHHMIYNIVRGKPLSRGFGEHTEGYSNALVFFKRGLPYPSYVDTTIYEPFKEYMTREQYIAFIEELKVIAKEHM